MRRIKVAEAQFGKTKQNNNNNNNNKNNNKSKNKKKKKKKNKQPKRSKKKYLTVELLNSQSSTGFAVNLDNNHISLVQHSLKELHVWS